MFFKKILFIVMISSLTARSQKVDPGSLKLGKSDSIVFSRISIQDLNDHKNLIEISKEEFSKTIKEENFYLERINSHKDSLFVFLQHEFKDWKLTNNAFRRIDFSWLRLRRNLRLSKQECKELGDDLGLYHPYLIFLFFRDETQHPLKAKHINRLKRILHSEVISRKKLDSYSNKQLLTLSFRQHPDIKKLRSKHRKKH